MRWTLTNFGQKVRLVFLKKNRVATSHADALDLDEFGEERKSFDKQPAHAVALST